MRSGLYKASAVACVMHSSMVMHGVQLVELARISRDLNASQEINITNKMNRFLRFLRSLSVSIHPFSNVNYHSNLLISECKTVKDLLRI